ncbi:MAG: Pr6Pr family membrane protein [Pseudomonadota bacterium]|nr:Pr6Pr family membrane protein [Pseudomonadota bacterium]
MTPAARIGAAVVAVIACASLIGQFILGYGPEDTAVGTIWARLRYFTIITGIMVAATFTWMTLSGRRAEPRWTAGITLWILIVMVVYHGLLATYGKSGLAFWTDHGSHTFTPILTALWWLVFARHIAFPWRLAILWLAYPAIYLAYALLRGAFDGVYPYFFVDLSRFPASQILVYCIGLCIAFWLAGLGMIAVARVRARV